MSIIVLDRYSSVAGRTCPRSAKAMRSRSLAHGLRDEEAMLMARTKKQSEAARLSARLAGKKKGDLTVEKK